MAEGFQISIFKIFFKSRKHVTKTVALTLAVVVVLGTWKRCLFFFFSLLSGQFCYFGLTFLDG